MTTGWLHGRGMAGLVAGLLAIGTGCSILESPGGGFNLISVDDEWQMGRQFDREIRAQMDVVSDPEVDAFLNTLGQRLLGASTSDLARLPWSFHLVLDDSVNAFNIPGGAVYVNSGLVAAMNTYAELAAVVGHEVGHGLSRHGTEQMTKQYGLSLVMALALGNDPSWSQQLVASVAAGGTLMKFRRDDELEADRTGTHLMYYSGIDPRGAIAMFQVLASISRGNPGAIERFLASHPMPETRISEAERRISTLPPRSDLVSQTADFAAFKSRVASLAGR